MKCARKFSLSSHTDIRMENLVNFHFRPKPFHIFIILWQTRQIKSLFNLKNKNTHMQSSNETVLVVTATLVRPWEMYRCHLMNILQCVIVVVTLRLPAIYTWILHIPLAGANFAQLSTKRSILKGLMIQQWKQVHCYIAKLFPPGIT